MNTSPTACSSSISCSLPLRRSVTNQISPASRSGRGSTGRARKPPSKRVVSMHTPTFSTISQTRSILLSAVMILQLATREPVPSGLSGCPPGDKTETPAGSEDDQVLDRPLCIRGHDLAGDEIVPVLERHLGARIDDGLDTRLADLRKLVEFGGSRRVEVD